MSHLDDPNESSSTRSLDELIASLSLAANQNSSDSDSGLEEQFTPEPEEQEFARAESASTIGDLEFRIERLEYQVASLLQSQIAGEHPVVEEPLPSTIQLDQVADQLDVDSESDEPAQENMEDWLQALKSAIVVEEAAPEIELPDEDLGPDDCGAEQEVEDAFLSQLPPFPESVDWDTADLSTLQEAVSARDQMIEACIDHLRNVTSNSSQLNGFDWNALSEGSHEYPEKLSEVLGQLKEQVRLNEITMSLERARLSRQRSELIEARDQIRKMAIRCGQEIPDTGQLGCLKSAPSPVAERKAPNQKWLSLLRINRNGAEE